MKKFKRFIASFFVAFILLFKVAGLHALSHDGDDTDLEHCEVCHVTTTAGFIPLLETESFLVPQVEHYLSERELKSIVPYVVFNDNCSSNYLFTRPPPLFFSS